MHQHRASALARHIAQLRQQPVRPRCLQTVPTQRQSSVIQVHRRSAARENEVERNQNTRRRTSHRGVAISLMSCQALAAMIATNVGPCSWPPGGSSQIHTVGDPKCELYLFLALYPRAPLGPRLARNPSVAMRFTSWKQTAAARLLVQCTSALVYSSTLVT